MQHGVPVLLLQGRCGTPEQEFEGMLSIESIEKVIQAGMEYAEHICSFAFQGGEPTLSGLDFYRQVVVLQKQYAKPGCGNS